MKRLSALVLVLALLSLGLAPSGDRVQAHPVAVDASALDWTSIGPAPIEKQVGHIVRNAAGQGQYAWRDPGNDARRLAGETAPGATELRQLRVTGSPAALSIYAQFARVADITGPRATQLQLALRTDASAPGGGTSFVAPATASPSLPAANAWQYLVQTRFAGGAADASGLTAFAQPLVYDSPGAAGSPVGAGRFSKIDNSIELSIPWSALGSAGGPLARVHFAVAVLRSNGAQPADGIASNVRDVVSPRTTADELADGSLDYGFDVYFDPAAGPTLGEPYSPLLITELTPLVLNADNTTDTRSQWLEVTNTGAAAFSAEDVAQFKVGDASNKDSTEGMFSLPAHSLSPGESLVIARQRNLFKKKYPAGPAYPALDYGSGSGASVGGNVYGLFNDGKSGGGTNLLAPYAPVGWLANTSVEPDGPFQLPVTGVTTYTDQLVLLDAQDTLVDVVQYASPGVTDLYPGHTPLSAPAGGFPSKDNNYQRCPASRDTNNGDADFAYTTVRAQETPGATCVFSDLYVQASGPSNVVASVLVSSTQTYVLTYGNNRMPAANAVLTATLPLTMSLLNIAASDQTLPLPSSATVGGRQQLVWHIANPLPTGFTAQISLTTSLPAGTPRVPTALDAKISGPASQPESEELNNAFTLPVLYVAEPTADIGVTKRVADASQLYPEGAISYRVDVANTGTADAAGVTLLDTVPPGLHYLANSLGLVPTAPAANQVQFGLGTLPMGTLDRSLLITFTVDADVVVGATVQNQVAITTTTAPESPADNNTALSEAATVGPKPPTADLTIAKSVKDASVAYPGGQIVYSITYSNGGTLDSDDATIVDAAPAGLRYAGNSLDLAAETVGGEVRFTLGALDAPTLATTVLVTFTVAPDAVVGSVVRNQASIETTSPEAPLTNNSATSEPVTVLAAPVALAPDLAVTKQLQGASLAHPRDTVVYTIAYRNDGNAPATGVQLDDHVPTGLRYVSNSAGLSVAQPSPGVVRIALGTLAPGATGSVQLSFEVEVAATVGATLVNQVAISSATPEVATANNTASAGPLTVGPHLLFLPLVAR